MGAELSADDLLAMSPQETEWEKREKMTPDEKVIEAMRKALACTTPEHAGAPWEYKDERRGDKRNVRIEQSGRRDSD